MLAHMKKEMSDMYKQQHDGPRIPPGSAATVAAGGSLPRGVEAGVVLLRMPCWVRGGGAGGKEAASTGLGGDAGWRRGVE